MGGWLNRNIYKGGFHKKHMETKLKTLKDLTPVKTGKYELLKLNCGKDFVPIDELKAEAVKWFKQLKRFSHEESFIALLRFFNLTPADLQEKKK